MFLDDQRRGLPFAMRFISPTLVALAFIVTACPTPPDAGEGEGDEGDGEGNEGGDEGEGEGDEGEGEPTCADGDDDEDGTCNSVDVCPGGSDTLDDDADGRPNGCEPYMVRDVNAGNGQAGVRDLTTIGAVTYFGG